jgi:hypothetical protein
MNWRLLLLLCASLLASCASAPPYPSYAGKDAACISGGMANVVKFFSSGRAHTAVKEIDGVPSPGDGPFCLSPGAHRLGVWAWAVGHQEAQEYIDVDLQAGVKYELRGTLRGISIDVSLVALGEGAAAEREVASYSLRAHTGGQQSYTPIFLPAKK